MRVSPGERPAILPGSRVTLRNNPSLRWLWCAHLISQLGDGFYTVALPWLVYQHTHSASQTTAVLAASSLSFLIVGPIAGVFVDRWDRRRTLIGADLLRALVLMTFPLTLLVGFNFPAVLAIAVLLPAFGRFFTPAQRATVPGLVPPDQLVAVNAMVQSAGSAAYIAGPAAAGVLIIFLGSVPLLMLDGLTFVCSAILLCLVRFPLRPPSAARAGFRGELAEGFRVSWRIPALRGACLVAAAGTLFFAPVPALLAVWVGGGAGKSEAFGLLTALFFFGSLAGSLIVARVGSRFQSRTLIVYGLLAMGVSIVIFGRAHQLLIGGLGLALLGAFLSSYNVGILTVLQRLAPAGALGRVMAVNDTAAWSLRPFTILTCGALADLVGVHALLVVIGAGMLLLGLITLRSSWLRDSTAAKRRMAKGVV